MFLGYAFGGLAPCEPFQLGCFDQESQGIPCAQFFWTQLAEAFDRLVLHH